MLPEKGGGLRPAAALAWALVAAACRGEEGLCWWWLLMEKGVLGHHGKRCRPRGANLVQNCGKEQGEGNAAVVVGRRKIRLWFWVSYLD